MAKKGCYSKRLHKKVSCKRQAAGRKGARARKHGRRRGLRGCGC